MTLKDPFALPPPIVLRAPATLVTSVDESGSSVTTANLGSAPNSEGPYSSINLLSRAKGVPPLSHFCILVLLNYVDQLPSLDARPVYKKWQQLDVLKSLLGPADGPDYDPKDGSVNLSQVDPRLWATIIQLYANLPPFFLRYDIPLSDKWLPLLQRIEPKSIGTTDGFTLITTLDLSNQLLLTDENVVDLKGLHQLCTFDCSYTALSNRGVDRFSKTLMIRDGEQKIGPWKLRVWYLKGCGSIDDQVTSHLEKWPLLCLIGCVTGTFPRLDRPFR